MTNIQTSYRVTCEDGQVRHDQPFKTLSEAMTWAEWGHCCTAHHDIKKVDA